MRVLIIEDEIIQLKKLKGFFEESFPDFQIEVRDLNNLLLSPEKKNGWYSGNYGQKEPTEYQVFRTSTSKFITRIFKPGISNQ